MTEYFCAYCEQYHGIHSGCVKESPSERDYEPEEDDEPEEKEEDQKVVDDRDFSKNRFDL